MGQPETRKRILRYLRQSKLNYTSIMNLSVQMRMTEEDLKKEVEDLSSSGTISVMSSGYISLTAKGLKAINDASDLI